MGLPFMSARLLMSSRGCVIRTCGSFWNTAITAFTFTPSFSMFRGIKPFEPIPKSAAPPAINCGTFTPGPPWVMETLSPAFS